MSEKGFRKVAGLSELREKGVMVVKGGRYGIALFYSEGDVYAVDNRCPHLGFPLHMGSVKDGILTCHWHNAQFDLCSGGTFDPFADDVPVYPVAVRDGEVWLNPTPTHTGAVERAKERLERGMEQNIDLVVAKAVVSLLDLSVSPKEIVCQGALHGARYRQAGWRSGMTILAAMANAYETFDEVGRVHALYEGLRHVSSDCAGQAPAFRLQPLANDGVDTVTLERWFRRFIEARRADGAERALLTAIQTGVDAQTLTRMIFNAATDHFYRDGGHVFDFSNKACELLDFIGWQHAGEILPTLVAQLATSSRSEEMNSWKHPIDLVTPLLETFDQLPDTFGAGAGEVWTNAAPLVESLLGDDPLASFEAISEAIRLGAQPAELGRALTYAAAVRIARFNTRNEFDDWISVAHTFTYANAVQRALERLGTQDGVEATRAVFHGAVAIYMDRFFNVPPARLPWERRRAREEQLKESPAPQSPLVDGALQERLFGLLDARDNADEAEELVYNALGKGNDAVVWQALGSAMLREDVEFHTFQVFEAGYRQYTSWERESPALNGLDPRVFLMAVTRYLAAHSPTMRQAPFIAEMARRLQRGDALDIDQGYQAPHS